MSFWIAHFVCFSYQVVWEYNTIGQSELVLFQNIKGAQRVSKRRLINGIIHACWWAMWNLPIQAPGEQKYRQCNWYQWYTPMLCWYWSRSDETFVNPPPQGTQWYYTTGEKRVRHTVLCHLMDPPTLSDMIHVTTDPVSKTAVTGCAGVPSPKDKVGYKEKTPTISIDGEVRQSSPILSYHAVHVMQRDLKRVVYHWEL